MMCKNNTYYRKLRLACWGSTAVKLIAIPAALVTAEFISYVLDQALAGKVWNVIRGSIFMLITVITLFLIQAGGELWLRKRKEQDLYWCRQEFLKSLFHNPLDHLFQADYGSLIQNLNDDIKTVAKRYLECYPTIISSSLGVVGYLVFLLVQSPIVAVSLLAISLLQLIPPLIVKRYMQVNYDDCAQIESQITNHVVEAVNGFEAIKLYDLKNWWQDKLRVYHRSYLKVGNKSDATATAQISMYRLLEHLLKFGTYGLLGMYVLLDYCPLDVTIQAAYLSGGLFQWVKSLFSTIPDLAVAKTAEHRLDKWNIPDTETGVNDSNGTEMTLTGVSYSADQKEIFQMVDYQFHPDEVYLLKGGNGTGKSTLLHLLAGLILPNQGEILADPVWYVPQDDPEYSYTGDTFFSLFGAERQRNMTAIAVQMGLSRDLLAKQEIRNLSGGERKKVFLAAAFGQNSKWLLLDEPSNHLDQHGKEILCQLIQNRKGIVIASHDPELFAVAEHILHIGNGRISDETE